MSRLTNKKLALPNNVFISPKTEEERRAYTELARGVDIRAIYNRLAELEDKIEKGTLQEIPEGAVVIPEKITEETSAETLIKIAKYNEKVRKETAKTLAATIMSVLWEEEKDESVKIKDVHAVIRDILSERYGVEVENESGND